MRRTTRSVLALSLATMIAFVISGQSGGGTKRSTAPPVQKRHSATQLVLRVQSPKPFHLMTLKELAAFQERTLSVYVSRWRFWQTHRARLIADVGRLERCQGIRAPHWACWSYKAARWTKRELDETRLRQTNQERIALIARLNRGLLGTPMEGLGALYEKAGRAHNVNPFFMAAAAGTESSFGAASCGNFNAWGLGNCEGSSWVPSFANWGEAIDWYARYLRRTWPNAQTPYDLTHPNYAACPSCWGRKTSWWMSTRFGEPGRVAYPLAVAAAL